MSETEDLKAIAEGYCPMREDKVHCAHWWDNGPCCNCGSPKAEFEDEKEDDED
jgi:hypothetical protein